jgi:transcriptional regulator with XRE-family HTH domain
MRHSVESHESRLRLAERLRGLREERDITQPVLARVFEVSVPLISSWESRANPKIPPLPRLEAYAALFASARSFTQDPPVPLAAGEMTADEQRMMDVLVQELMQLRSRAMGADPEPVRAAGAGDPAPFDLWRFADEDTITIVCAQLPRHMLARMPYTDMDDPDYIELLSYSELDALFELHGHLRATNPRNQVNRRVANNLASDDYTSHLASLGGIDWNTVTSSTLEKLPLPVSQVADWDTEGGQYFEVQEGGKAHQHRPILEKSGNKKFLREDVALFARAVSPFNRERTVTICNGMYGRGTFGAVRALTDARFRQRNGEYLRSRFGDSKAYCILTRVPIVDGKTLTPDWTDPNFRLFEWSV